MKRFVLAVFIALSISFSAYAVAPSNASLKGTYASQTTGVHMRSWSKTVSVTCGGIQYTYAGGGSTVVTVLMQGTATFTGTGTFSGSMTEWGDINQTASNNTVTIKCTGNPNQPYTTNSGNPVYNTPETLTVSGTYTITSSGIGTMTVNLEGVEPMNLILGEFSSTGVAGFVMMRQIESNDEVDSFGVLMLKSN